MKYISNFTFGILAVAAAGAPLSGCKKSHTSSRREHHIRYEITGNVSVPIYVQYTPAITDPYYDPSKDTTDYDETVTLPWKKYVTEVYNVGGVGLAADVGDALEGQKLTLKVFDLDVDSLNAAKKLDLVVDAYGNTSGLINYYFDHQ